MKMAIIHHPNLAILKGSLYPVPCRETKNTWGEIQEYTNLNIRVSEIVSSDRHETLSGNVYEVLSTVVDGVLEFDLRDLQDNFNFDHLEGER